MSDGDIVNYQPSEWQQRFHDTTRQGINEVLGAGSAGPGKTFCLVNDCNDQIIVEHERCSNPRHRYHQAWGASTGWALHLRRTRLNLEQSIVLARKLFLGMDPGFQWNEQKATGTFSSGFKYQFGHCKDPNDWENFSSFNLTALFFDELTEFNEEQYDQICRRVRSSDPVLKLMLKIRSMSNPLMRRTVQSDFVVHDPNWVRRRFVDGKPEGNCVFKRKLTRQDGSIGWHKWLYMPAKLKDNPDKEFVKQYELNLLNSPPHIRAALLDGDWYVTVGSFFAKYWNARLHVCKPFKVPSNWRIFRSMDWGYKNPGCIHWGALDEDGTLFVVKEVRFQEKLDNEVAAIIKSVESDPNGVFGACTLWDDKRDESLITGVADTQLWEQRGDSGKNKASVFADNGVTWRPADKKSRQTNAQHVIKRLEDHDFGTKVPGLVIFETCPWIIKVLPAIQTSTHNTEEPADGGDDHPWDSLAYLCAFASKGKAAIPATREPKDEWDDDDADSNTARRGKHGYGQELC